MRPLFQRCFRFSGARARKKRFRVDSSEVERTARLLCLGNSEVRLLWVPVIGKSQVAIPTKGTHHHYGPASVVYVVSHDRSPERILVVGTRIAAWGVEPWEERATVRHRSHLRQLQRQAKRESQRSQREGLTGYSSFSPASQPAAGRFRSERLKILRGVRVVSASA